MELNYATITKQLFSIWEIIEKLKYIIKVLFYNYNNDRFNSD